MKYSAQQKLNAIVGLGGSNKVLTTNFISATGTVKQFLNPQLLLARRWLQWLYYQCDDSAVGHDFYLRQLGFADKMKFPDFQSDDKLDSFRHILADFELISADFFEGDCKELKRIAKVQKETIDFENKERQTEYTDHFDLDIIRRARQEFKDKKFKESIRTYGTVKKKELLTDLDRKTLKIANERVR